MAAELGPVAEVKTFHAYCKKLLYERRGGLVLFPLLTQIIEEDAKALDPRLKGCVFRPSEITAFPFRRRCRLLVVVIGRPPSLRPVLCPRSISELVMCGAAQPAPATGPEG